MENLEKRSTEHSNLTFGIATLASIAGSSFTSWISGSRSGSGKSGLTVEGSCGASGTTTSPCGILSLALENMVVILYGGVNVCVCVCCLLYTSDAADE